MLKKLFQSRNKKSITDMKILQNVNSFTEFEEKGKNKNEV